MLMEEISSNFFEIKGEGTLTFSVLETFTISFLGLEINKKDVVARIASIEEHATRLLVCFFNVS